MVTLENLGPNINGPQTWEAQPSLSGDGNTLFFHLLDRVVLVKLIFIIQIEMKTELGPKPKILEDR